MKALRRRFTDARGRPRNQAPLAKQVAHFFNLRFDWTLRLATRDREDSLVPRWDFLAEPSQMDATSSSSPRRAVLDSLQYSAWALGAPTQQVTVRFRRDSGSARIMSSSVRSSPAQKIKSARGCNSSRSSIVLPLVTAS